MRGDWRAGGRSGSGRVVPGVLVLIAVGLSACSGTGSAGDSAPTSAPPSSAVTSSAAGNSSSGPSTGASAEPACVAVADPPPSRTGRWARVALPARATRTGSALLSVAAAGPRTAWAVGYAPPESGSDQFGVGLALGWDGVRWTIQSLPPKVNRLLQVAAVSSTEAWAVGVQYPASGDPDRGSPRVLRWNGLAWSDVPLGGVDGGVGISGTAKLSTIAADACGRVYLGGHDPRGGFVAQWHGTGWTLLPAPSSDDRASVSYLSLAPRSRVWAGVLHDIGAEVQSWDGTAWRSEKIVFGSHVSLFRLDAFTDQQVWFISNEPFMGGPINRPPAPNQVYAAAVQPSSESAADPRSLNLPATRLIAGWSKPRWLYGSGVLAQQVGDRWVRRSVRLPNRFEPADLRAVPGSGQLWMVGARGLTSGDVDTRGTAAVVRFLPR